jgi:hypothetical protein
LRFEKHCAHCIEVLGEPFEEVNLWMDYFHRHPPEGQKYASKHRRYRHHKAGIEQVRAIWGDRAAEAAKLHMLDDLKTGEAHEADETWVPEDEADYLKRGYW